jgi:uncharacterized protein (TIGR02996 family)
MDLIALVVFRKEASMSEEGFLQSVLDDPKDPAVLLVYADWLDEQGDAVSAVKAEFLRLSVAPAEGRQTRKRKKARRKRLQQLAATLDTAWLAVVSRLPIEKCQGKQAQAQSQRFSLATFNYVCDRCWEDLRTTDDRAVRFCDACQHDVHYCDTIGEARKHASAGHCIAVDLGVIRRDDDLEPQRFWLGHPSAETLRKEAERVQPDAVSAERERKKRSAQGEGTTR